MSFRKSVLKTFKKILPPISQTEREALESGTVGWDGELMKGTPNWNVLFNLPTPALTDEEQAFLDGPVEELCRMLDNWSIQAEDDLPREVWDFIKDKGFMGLEIPKEFGGHGFSSKMHSDTVIKIASRSITAAVTVMVPNSLGPAELLLEYGTDAQKQYYLPRLAKGIDIPCFALTEPNAGSDAGAMEATGIVCKNDKGEIGIKLNWEKRYITLGPVATLIGLAFKLYDPDHLLNMNGTDLGITVALIHRDTPGIDIGNRHKPMDLPFQNGPNRGKDVFVPIGNIIGGKERAGQGWKMLMECLAVGRSLSLPALSTAGAKLCSYTAGSYSRVRKQFNIAISNFEGIEEPLARIAGKTYLMNAAREATLKMVDEGERPAIPSAILKYHLTENMRGLVNDTMDIFGGKAICDGPSNIMADLYKGIPVAITVEGANIMTRNLIIFGQGAMRAHPYLSKEVNAVNIEDEDEAFKTLYKNLSCHVGSALKHFVKALWYAVTFGVFSHVPDDVHSDTRKYYKKINRLSACFNLMTEVTLLALGGGLKRRERISARLGDVYSQLYLSSTTLWYFEKMGAQKEDLPLLHWSLQRSLFDAQTAFDAMRQNHPLGWVMWLLMFSLGGIMRSAPSDKMDAKVAKLITEPGDVRDRLSNGIFKPMDTSQQLGVLEKAFVSCVAAEPLEKKLRKAIQSGQVPAKASRTEQLSKAQEAGVLTAEDVATIMEAETLRLIVVNVDEFPQDVAAVEIHTRRAQSAA